MAGFVQDLRYTLRQFRRSPGFFGIAVLLIAVAIAANAQIFTLADALLLRPLPVRDRQNLVQLFEIRPRTPPSPYFDYRFYKQLAANTSTLFDIAAKRELVLPLEHSGITERSYIHFVTANFFSERGVRPVPGRPLGNGDDHTGVISYDCWNPTFNRDPRVLGRILHFKGHAFQIIGVAPERFTERLSTAARMCGLRSRTFSSF